MQSIFQCRNWWGLLTPSSDLSQWSDPACRAIGSNLWPMTSAVGYFACTALYLGCGALPMPQLGGRKQWWQQQQQLNSSASPWTQAESFQPTMAKKVADHWSKLFSSLPFPMLTLSHSNISHVRGYILTQSFPWNGCHLDTGSVLCFSSYTIKGWLPHLLQSQTKFKLLYKIF